MLIGLRIIHLAIVEQEQMTAYLTNAPWLPEAAPDWFNPEDESSQIQEIIYMANEDANRGLWRHIEQLKNLMFNPRSSIEDRARYKKEIADIYKRNNLLVPVYCRKEQD